MKYVCLVFSDHDCDRLKNQGTSTIWYKFSGQAGTRLPTCDQVESHKVSRRFVDGYGDVFCIQGEHPDLSFQKYMYLYHKSVFHGSTGYGSIAMDINITVRKCGDEYIYGIPATSCPSDVHFKIMGI